MTSDENGALPRVLALSKADLVTPEEAAQAAATSGRSFIIPINWRSYSANVVVCLQ